MPYAATRNGTLDLAEDDHGLHWAARLDADDPESQVLARKVKSGLISECSFAFRVSDDDWSADFKTRRIRSVTLNRGDVSLVHAGANPATSVAMRPARPCAFRTTTTARREFELLRRGHRPPAAGDAVAAGVPGVGEAVARRAAETGRLIRS